MVEVTAEYMSFQQACVLLKIMIFQWKADTVALYANMPLQIL